MPSDSKESDNPSFKVVVVDSVEAAEQELPGTNFLVFVTLGMLGVAERIQAKHRRLKVIVLTGLLPDGRVRLIDKRWVATRDGVRNLVRE